MKIAKFDNVSEMENLRVFKPISKIAIIATYNGVSDADLIDKFRMRVRLVDGQKGDSIDILPETEISLLSEIASKFEGFQRRPLFNGTTYNGIGTFCIPIGAQVDGLLHSINLSNDKYLDIDLVNLPKTNKIKFEVYGIEGVKTSSFTRKYSKYYLSAGELEKSFSTGENEILALPLDSLKEIQMYAKNSSASPVYTREELRIEEDSRNDINFIRCDENYELLLASASARPVSSISPKSGVPSSSSDVTFVGGGVSPISFGSGNIVLLPLEDFVRFDVRRREDKSNYQFIMIDTVPTKS